MEHYTELSQKAYEYAIFPTLTPQAGAQWIDGNISFRTLPEKLINFYPGTAEEMKAVIHGAE